MSVRITCEEEKEEKLKVAFMWSEHGNEAEEQEEK